MLPNLIIVGVNKGGTTSLFRYLAGHNDVCGSEVKETCHFLPLRYGCSLPPLDGYERQFDHFAGESLVIESTPGYFYGGADVANAIEETLPNVRVVLVLRDPVKRFFSFFHYMKGLQAFDVGLSATDYLEQCHTIDPVSLNMKENNPWFGLAGGCYVNWLAPWAETFGERLKVTFFEDLSSDPLGYLQKFAEFAEIDPVQFETMKFHQENKTRGHASARLHSMALSFYQTAGTWLNRHVAIKRTLATLYARLNENPVRRDIEDEKRATEALVSYFAASTAQLRSQLDLLPDCIVGRPYPAWLANKYEDP